MKLFLRTLAALMACALTVPAATAQQTPVKREMRSAWVATVTRDWPSKSISGAPADIQQQKNEMITLLDSLKANNMNAICLQTRSKCDAIYPSSYEPWCEQVGSGRGTDPGYDPLAFAIEEAHKRGLEFHAWINPYRYESVKGQFGNVDYRITHPDWLLDGPSSTILNPGLPEVRQRICDVIKEIVSKYDVDGILFDDYFYLPEGTDLKLDVDLYNKYKTGNMTQQNWRRNNVNQMVRDVYKTIKETKPWVRFGIGPAGVTCRTQAMANQYDVPICPIGDDWTYSKIFCEPLAWLKDQALDYISPQIYWRIGSSQDYDQICRWWSQVADKFGRHVYPSHYLETVTAWGFDELSDQVALNRRYTRNEAPGSVFFSSKYMFSNPDKFGYHLRKTVFTSPALLPPMTWETATDPGAVKNVTRNGATLDWDAIPGMRYTVYAVPQGASFDRQAAWLLGMTYTNSYTLPNSRLVGFDYYVCPLDRFANEYEAASPAVPANSLDAPVITAPADGAELEMPFTFSWTAVRDAQSYIITFANDAAMSDVIMAVAVDGNEATATGAADCLFRGLPVDRKIYWRVNACAAGYKDGVSASRALTPRNFQILYPGNNAIDVELSPDIRWTFPDRKATLQLASSADFGERNIVLEINAEGGSYQIPRCFLAGNTQYFARVISEDGAKTTPTVSFTTKFIAAGNPDFLIPQDGGTWHADQPLRISPVEGMREVRVEVAATPSITVRNCWYTTTFDRMTWCDTKVNNASEIKISSKAMQDGNVYYARLRSTYVDADGKTVTNDYSPLISFTYSSQAGVDGIGADDNAENLRLNGNVLTVTAPSDAAVKLYNASGRLVADLYNGNLGGSVAITLSDLPAGLYIAVLNGTHTLKIVR